MILTWLNVWQELRHYSPIWTVPSNTYISNISVYSKLPFKEYVGILRIIIVLRTSVVLETSFVLKMGGVIIFTTSSFSYSFLPRTSRVSPNVALWL